MSGVAYLFDTDAISEVLRKLPAPAYIDWLSTVKREDQFVSAVSIAELYRGAFGSEGRARHLTNIEERVLPAVTVLPFGVKAARVFGSISAQLDSIGERLADADLQIAATALAHDMIVVTGNVRHFTRVPKLRLETVLAEAKRAGGR